MQDCGGKKQEKQYDSAGLARVIVVKPERICRLGRRVLLSDIHWTCDDVYVLEWGERRAGSVEFRADDGLSQEEEEGLKTDMNYK